ncbi:hypothetical protein [Anabaena sp. UHCC 0399]|uniref:hypothetical protein n=1 Tax=Anabaena sp. UHCC 0399 TaxID=3110238 RepID=UPI0016898829|nr:hypothetical protein [Anabaena sp. UHCC 0399]MBD2364359.1 hypothetical protein [Anabaena minutissima FACHB-250]MEA5567377.1 hypothetical protein [Anabaena sp. UHCC 0399]
MDPISLVIAALGAGAIAAAKDTAGVAVKDAYQGLKALIKKKFESEPKAQMVLEEHETDPETYEAPLKKKLAEAGIDKDEEIIKLAQELLKQEKPEESAAGKFNTVFQGEVKGVQIGDRNTQTNTF